LKDTKNTVENSTFRIGKWFPDLSEETVKLLSKYNDEIIRFNKAINLVSSKTLPMADLLHFSDSILASRAVLLDAGNINEIFDLGSGSGFPGLVFAVLNQQIQVKLVESDFKKCEFLKHMVATLDLKNVVVLNQTLETLGESSIKCCFARGLSTISKSLFLMRKAVVPGGSFYHLKSEEWSMEIGEIPSQLCSIWAPSLVTEYRLPMGEIKFSIVKTIKIK